jgi:hypothetical protein
MFEEWHATAAGGTERRVTVPGRPDSLAGAETVTYATSFEDPRGADDDVAVLSLRGLYAGAEVSLTGDRLAGEGPVEHDAYFEPLRIPFRPHEADDLSVTCHAPRDRFGGIHDTDRVPPEKAVPGIWWDASLESRPLPCVDSLTVRPEVTGENARLHVRTTVVTDGPIQDRITYSLKPEGDLQTRGMMDRGTVETSGPGATTVEHTFDVRDPALWWPRELGPQHRYRLRAKLGDSERAVTVGICEIERDGSHLVVNGQPLPIRGVDAVDAEPGDVERALAVDATLVRATAAVPSQSFYEACDEAGLVVWQDLPLTGPGAFDADRGADLARRLAAAYGHHPSLAVFGVHDEPTDAFADGLGSGLADRLRLRWRAWRTDYDSGPAETIADAVPDFRPTVPVVGGPGVGSAAAAYYPGWDYGEADDVGALLDRYPADILAAFGAGALASDTADAAGFDADKHARHVAGGVEQSQAYQAAVVRTVAEAARRRGLGAVAFSLRDTDGAGTGVYAADGSPKAARDALAAAFRPVAVLLADPSPGEATPVVVNDRPEALSATLSWAAGDAGGDLEVAVDATDRSTAGPIAIPADADSVTLGLSTDPPVETTYDL